MGREEKREEMQVAVNKRVGMTPVGN